MSEAISLSIDSKGRINISKEFIIDIYIYIYIFKKKTVLFVGKEIIFEMRSQDLFAKHLEECKQIAEKNCNY